MHNIADPCPAPSPYFTRSPRTATPEPSTTHHKPTVVNRRLVVEANDNGFNVNWSAETLEQADRYAELDAGPVVRVLPADQLTPVRTPAGRLVTVCPAVTGNTDCLNCGICQQRDRQAIVGFPAHGSGAKRVQKVFFMQKVPSSWSSAPS